MDDVPRNFHEVGIILRQITEDIAEIRKSQERVYNVVVIAVLCPLLVGGTLAYFFWQMTPLAQVSRSA